MFFLLQKWYNRKILENPNVGSLIIPSFYRVSNQKIQYKEYLLTKDGFTLYMFNIQGYNDFKMAYINKFNEMEKKLQNQFKVPTNFKEALQLALEQQEKIEVLALENIKQKNYIDHVVINKKYYITPIQIGNKFDMSAKALNKILNEVGVIYKKGRKWYLTSEYYGVADYRYYQKPNGE